jgi:hypothetical protein
MTSISSPSAGSKAQSDLTRLCLEPAEGLEIEVIKKPQIGCGITTGLMAAIEDARGRSRAMESMHCREKSAWDAVCALSQFTGSTGSGYFQRIFKASEALLRGARGHSVCLAFDDAEYIAPSVPGLVRVCEDVQRALSQAAKRTVGMRLVFPVGRCPLYVARDRAGRWIGEKVSSYPFLALTGRRGWEWSRAGMKVTKERDPFMFWDTEEDAPLLAVESA